MKVLFVSRYVDPINPRANHNIIRQARVLQDELDIDLEILTWPQGKRGAHSDMWGGAVPDQTPTLVPLKMQRDGLSYSVIMLPPTWDELAGGNVIGEKAWNDAVEYGVKLLSSLKPDVFHLHHRFGFWWLLESAQRLSIPTVYTNYDWGMACLRTVLVNSAGELCDGHVKPEKCASCIKKGRTRLLGRWNESFVETYIGRGLLNFLEKFSLLSEKFRHFGVVTQPAIVRTLTHQKRVSQIIKKLGHCVTPSPFGAHFFQQFGIAEENITVIPWFHKKVEVNRTRISSAKPLTITFIGRVSPDKGVHLIFEALEHLEEISPVLLRVVGADGSDYCNRLQSKYSHFVGSHHVEWLGWSPVDGLLRSTDFMIIPSTVMDNTPSTLIEAIAYQVPVIATAIPTITWLLPENEGFFAEYNSAVSLAGAIKKAVLNKNLCKSGIRELTTIPSERAYGEKLVDIYTKLLV